MAKRTVFCWISKDIFAHLILTSNRCYTSLKIAEAQDHGFEDGWVGYGNRTVAAIYRRK